MGLFFNILTIVAFCSQITFCQILVESKNEQDLTSVPPTTTTTSDDYYGDLDYDCYDDQFDCGSGHCIEQAHICDGVADCSDGKDEIDCKNEVKNCTAEEFDCGDNFCVPLEKKCDGYQNCPNATDEEGCVSKTPISQVGPTTSTAEVIDGGDYYTADCDDNKFQCYDGICIEENLRCNGEEDCFDGEDEFGCLTVTESTSAQTESSSITPSETTEGTHCKGNQFQCSNMECVSATKVCDGTSDCGDASDEQNCTVATSTMMTRILNSTQERNGVSTDTSVVRSTDTGGCLYEGELYSLGSEIIPGNCSGILCNSKGQVLRWKDPTCSACLSAKLNSVILVFFAAICALANWR